MAVQIGTWYRINFKLDPWSYRNLLEHQARIGAPSLAAALRHILRRKRVRD